MASRTLVIVESPAKARTLGRYLGSGYQVAASVGHVRDLPKKELGVDIENGFEPTWVTIRGKGKVLTELRAKARRADTVLLATDPDREGEAIAYHVAEQLGYRGRGERFRRITFHEVTREAVLKALERPGSIDMHKVEAQQARRILDRLVGYRVSPFLWKPVRPGLSAGRVQTVALRLICEREDEIEAFVVEEYWSITAHLARRGEVFEARLHRIDGETFSLDSEAEARRVLAELEGVPFVVSRVKRRRRRRNPYPPFTTSTLQQSAAGRLRFPARKTMMLAQKLYEGVRVGGRGTTGLITYMRTDSTRVAAGAAHRARDWVKAEYGGRYLTRSARLWSGGQQKGAQDAHEAIRPTDPTLHPSEVARFVDRGAAALYELIWVRFVASQMAPMVYDTTTVDYDVPGSGGRHRYLFRASGSVVEFDGFSRLYRDAERVRDTRGADDLKPLPPLAEGEESDVGSLEPKQHFTEPPPRFSEASLVKELEKQGIGRPSTYAQIISTLQDRGYVEVRKRRFHPTELGRVVAKLLVRVFPRIFDVEFTSRMEDQLDRVEEGEEAWRDVLERFWPHLRERLEKGREISGELVRDILAADGESCEACGRPMLVRWNKHGRFLGCSGYPECDTTRSLDGPDVPEGRIGVDDVSGLPIHLKSGPYGPYLELGDGGGEGKPKRVGLPDGVDPEDVDLAYARRLVRLPRTLGEADDGEPVVAGLGRYGPYVRKGKTYADVKGVDRLFTVELEEALALIERKKKGGSRLIKDFGLHPETGRELRLLDGRYGPYVTDGKVNATLPDDMTPDMVRLDDAVALLKQKGGRRRGRRGRGRRRRRRGR